MRSVYTKGGTANIQRLDTIGREFVGKVVLLLQPRQGSNTRHRLHDNAENPREAVELQQALGAEEDAVGSHHANAGEEEGSGDDGVEASSRHKLHKVLLAALVTQASRSHRN